MKGILIFKLPEDRDDFELAQNADKLNCALHEFQEYLLRKYKHVEPANEDREQEYEEIRQRFLDFMKEWEIKLY